MAIFTRDVVFEQQPLLHDLQTKLTDFGGQPYIKLSGDRKGGCLRVPDLEELIKNGRPIDLIPTLRERTPNKCHENSIELFEEDETLVVMSGFARADDDNWYHHSWCVQDKDGEKKIIETVRANEDSEGVKDWRFLRYFGIEYAGCAGVQRLREWLDNEWPKAPQIKPGSPEDTIAKIINQQ